MIDLLIKICSEVHLNPSNHTIQIFAVDTGWPVDFKASQTFGSVGVNTIHLVQKKCEKDKNKLNTQLPPFEVFTSDLVKCVFLNITTTL